MRTRYGLLLGILGLLFMICTAAFPLMKKQPNSFAVMLLRKGIKLLLKLKKVIYRFKNSEKALQRISVSFGL